MLLLSRFGVLVVGLLLSRAAADYYEYEEIYDDEEPHLPVGHQGVPAAPQNVPVPVPREYPSDPNIVALPRQRGYVRGRELRTTMTGKAFKAFTGLKYGVVGSGLGRFQRPLPVGVYYNMVDGTAEPVDCPSFTNLAAVERAERKGVNVDDCLVLSVFTPNVFAANPVMVYIHGEMLFDGGSVEAKPQYLLEKDIVLVSVNYRLAPFGFMSTQTDAIPGNIAMADLELAFRWVKDNIAAFGGDPNSVTLFGQSGGATLIHAMSLSEKVNPVNFDRLILQSGTALNPLFIDEEPLASARGIAREAQCPAGSLLSPFDLSLCLGRLNTTQLLTAFMNHCKNNENRGIHAYGGFRLAVGDRLGYIPFHPALMLKAFNFPVVAGLAKDAGAFFLARKYRYDELVHLNSRNISDYINVILKHTTTPKYYHIWRQWAKTYIFSERDVQNPVLANLASGLLELTNLILYKAPLLESIKESWRTNATYLYSFDYRGQHHRYTRQRSHFPYEIDANLSDDNIYLFPYPDSVSRLGSEDRAVAQMMVRMWTNFASLEKPEEEGLWPRMGNEYGPLVRITNHLELDYHFGEGIPLPDLYGPMRTAAVTATVNASATVNANRRY